MKIRIQRNDMTAKTGYDFRRLEEKSHLFLPCRIEEEKDAVTMCFDLQGMKSFEELKGEDTYIKLKALLETGELKELYRKYDFLLEPGNLYYDFLGRIRVRQRDIILPSQRNRGKCFLKEYQVLILYILEGKRPYEDYLYGSKELLRAEHKLVMLLEAETVQEEKRILSEYYKNLQKEERAATKRVDRMKYKWLVRYSILSVFLIIFLLAVSVYSFVRPAPRQEKTLEAGEAEELLKEITELADRLDAYCDDGTEEN